MVLSVATPVLAHDGWRDHRFVSPREVAHDWRNVRAERRDVAEARRDGDWRDVRAERGELRDARREFRADRADLYRAGWDGDRDWDDRGRGHHGRGWGPGGRPGNDWAWHRDGWRQPGWHAEQYYVPGPRYRTRYLGPNDPIWRGYDNRYYCRRSDGTTGLIIGGLAGGTLGNVIAPGGSKLLGSVIGGSLGAILGNSIERGQIVCH
ncbi:MAG: hypothetical protein WCO11_06035 [Sphingomonadales bacterium]